MNRREFIRTTAEGAFFIASSGMAFGAGAPSNRVRLAIVGCHEMGRGFAVMKSAMKVPGVEIACVCDVDSRARAFAADYVLKATGVKPKMEKDLRIVLEDREIDGIVSETPDHFHAYSAVMAMRAGKAVYVEKPCCFCPAEGEVMMRVAKETGMVLQVGSQRRASRTIPAALDYVRTTGVIGELTWAKTWYMTNRASIGRGKVSAVPEWLDWDLWQACAPRVPFRDNVVHYNWHWFRNWGTSEMGNNAPHFVDVSRWALGLDSYPETVTCTSGKLFDKGDDYEWPDTFTAAYKYPNGKMISLELTSHCNGKPYMDISSGAMVYGTKGSLYFGFGDFVKLFDEKGKEIKEWLPEDRVSMAAKTMSTTNPTERLNVFHLTNFVECLRARNPKTFADADVGVKSSILPLYGNIAAERGGTLALDPQTGKLLSRAGADLWSREYAKGWEVV